METKNLTHTIEIPVEVLRSVIRRSFTKGELLGLSNGGKCFDCDLSDKFDILDQDEAEHQITGDILSRYVSTFK